MGCQAEYVETTSSNIAVPRRDRSHKDPGPAPSHQPERSQPERPSKSTTDAAVVVVLCSRQIEREHNKTCRRAHNKQFLERPIPQPKTGHPANDGQQRNRRQREDSVMSDRTVQKIGHGRIEVAVDPVRVHPVTGHTSITKRYLSVP